MKKLCTVVALFFIQMIAAQEISKNVGDFTRVSVFDRINLMMVASSENKIVIKGSRAGDVEIVNKNGELKVKMKLSKLLKGEDIEATLYYSGTIEGIEAAEGSYAGSQDTFKVVAFELNAKSGGHIKVSLDVQKLKSKVHSGGQLELSGSAANHDATITSGGILKAKGLTTAQTDISVNAGGEADITVTDFADAKTRAGGSIDIYGSPKQVNQKKVAGGSINIKG